MLDQDVWGGVSSFPSGLDMRMIPSLSFACVISHSVDASLSLTSVQTPATCVLCILYILPPMCRDLDSIGQTDIAKHDCDHNEKGVNNKKQKREREREMLRDVHAHTTVCTCLCIRPRAQHQSSCSINVTCSEVEHMSLPFLLCTRQSPRQTDRGGFFV